MKKLLVLILLLFYNISAQQTVDRIIAVVDNEIVLQSELDFRAIYEAAQRNISGDDIQLRRKVLDRIIEEKLVYAQAQLDSVVVSDDEVKQQIDYQMNYFIQQYGSKERVEQIYGMSIERIKRTLFDDTQKSLMTQRLQSKKFGQITVTRGEVQNFYTQYKDSLGQIPDKFEIAHIFINPKTGERIKNKWKSFAESLLDSLKNGADFAELAKKHSDDPGSASAGGDLGFVKRGVFYPEFEAAAYSLAPGEISGLVESPVGYHIIEMLERRGDAIHTRHILVKLESDNEADLQSIEFLSEIRDSIIRKQNTFEYYAKKYSDDKESSRLGGFLGSFEKNQLDKSLLDLVFKMKEGDITYPKRIELNPTTYGFHIAKLLKKIPAHNPNPEQDYEELKKLAVYNKQQKLYTEWIAELKDTIYWEIRL